MGGVFRFLACLGRVILGGVFLFSAIWNILDYSVVEQTVSEHMTKWLMLYPPQHIIATTLEEVSPWMPWLLLFGVGFKLLGSLLMVFGMRVRLAAFFLWATLLPTTLFLHDFWNVEGVQKGVEMAFFLKNSALLGSLMVIFAAGCGTSAPCSKKE